MIDDKKLAEIKDDIPNLIDDGIIDKSKYHTKLSEFFVETAEKSLNAARLLFKTSTEKSLMDVAGFPNFDGYLWVINASYYSMFYMASAALSHGGVKIRSDIGVHKLTFKAFVYYYYLTKKITKKLVEEYLQAQQDSQELLGQEEIHALAEKKATELITEYGLEREKRRRFTYELERTQIATRAKTSLERASDFYREVSKLIK
jgi:uncharacterized protein (UPF0332 family)